jgi:hypothetical protein
MRKLVDGAGDACADEDDRKVAAWGVTKVGNHLSRACMTDIP